MKRRLSLKWLFLLAFLSLGILLTIGYSLLSAHYFKRGMDNVILGNMAEAAYSYMRLVPEEDRHVLVEFSGYRMASDWAQMPEALRRSFGQAPQQPGVLYKHEEGGSWFRPPEMIHFAVRTQQGGDSVYVLASLTHDMSLAGEVAGRDAVGGLIALLGIGVAIVVVLVGGAWWLMHHVSRPVKALGQWARNLDADGLKSPTPDFTYPELNDMARLIRSSIVAAQESVVREQRFLTHASHELRTPISTIRNSLELLRKLQDSEATGWSPRQRQVVERVERASLTMKHLTETLLWLSRERQEALPGHPIPLDQLLTRLVDEMRYLLKDKVVEVRLDTQPCTATLPEAPARIVLGNLIRNAFAYTWEGRVVIRQREQRVWIDNENDFPETQNENCLEAPEEQRFGLGLQLTQQLTDKLGWVYRNRPNSRGHRVLVVFQEERHPPGLR